jgi:hypothetical protein
MAAWHLAQASFPGVPEEEARLCAGADGIVGVAAFSSVCALLGQLERQLQHKNATTSAMMIRCLCRGRRRASSQTVPASGDSELGETREVGRFNRAEVISRHTTTKTRGEQQWHQTPLGPARYSRSSCVVVAFALLTRFDEVGIGLSLLALCLERVAGICADASIFQMSVDQVAGVCCAILRLTVPHMSVQQFSVRTFSVFLLAINVAIIAEAFIELVEMFANETHLFAQCGQDGGRPAFAASDAADEGGIYGELGSDTLVQAAKYREHGKRICANIRVVTIHDALFNTEEKMYS